MLRYINTLSLDVAMGTMVGASFFGKILGVTSSFYELMGLGLTVWIIYTIDHLLDVVTLKERAMTHRHAFHQTYFGVLLLVVILVGTISLSLVFFMRKPVILWGSVLGVAIVVYFAFQQRLGLLKELSGAVLYTLGVLTPSVSLMPSAVSMFPAILIVLFAMVVWINLILFSWLSADSNSAGRQRLPIPVLRRNGRFGRTVFFGLFMIHFGLSAYCIVAYPEATPVVLILLLMSLILLLIFIYSNWFMKYDRYRIMGDVIFFFPLLQLLCSKN